MGNLLKKSRNLLRPKAEPTQRCEYCHHEVALTKYLATLSKWGLVFVFCSWEHREKYVEERYKHVRWSRQWESG
jgi:hypothetical protein